jgi:hypothetical protein
MDCIRDPEKTFPGSRGQKSTGSRISLKENKSFVVLWLKSAALGEKNICTLVQDK